MQLREISRRRFAAETLLGACTLASGGCGTIFYPERRGQPAGRLDWKVVAFDALGLLLFFIPGIVAFAVDFSTGAIYLPPDYYGKAERPDPRRDFTVHKLPRGQVNRESIERVVSDHAGQPVSLEPGEFETQELGSMEEFWPKHDALADAKQP
jgi:hypothetical protein